MNVCLPVGTFLREFEGLSMLCAPRKSGGVLFSDAKEYFLPIRDNLSLEEAALQISDKHNALSDEIVENLFEFYVGLERSGLVEIKYGNCGLESARINDVVYDKELSNTAEEVGYDLPINMFYDRCGCLSNLHIDLTDACTEQCVHCYIPQGRWNFVTKDLVEKVLQEFREQQGLTVQLSGGECMRHPDFAKICRLCRKLDLNFIVLSNLTLCDEKTIEVLKETDPQFVNVSLYSMVPEEHDAITQIRGSWQKTMMAIDACQQAGIHIRLATPLLKANQNAYPALRKFAEERHVHLVPDCEIIPKCNGDCSNLNYACSPEEVEAVLREDKTFWNRGYGRGETPKPEDKVCDIGQLLCLNSKGEYYPCSGMPGYVLGNARNDTLTEVWRGEKMERLRGLKNNDFHACVGCEHRPFCKVCPAFNYNATGSLFEPIPAKCALAEVKHRVFGGK